MTVRLAALTSHPIQYYAPLFRELAQRLDLHVFFAHRPTAAQLASDFGGGFAWDVDLTSGYAHSFLANVSPRPGLEHFSGCDTPEVGARLREGGFDGLLMLGWHLKSFVQALAAAKRIGLPVIVRGDSQLGTPRALYKRMAKALAYPVFLRSFDAALYVGTRSRTYYERYGYPRQRLFFSPHCVDTEWFASRATPRARAALRHSIGLHPADKAVLFAGKLVPFKRPVEVLQACAMLKADGLTVRAVVAGSGELEGEVRSRAAELGVPLHLLGFQNQSAMPAAYAAGDVLALPSTGQETWGLVCNEALACGRPIVVSDAAGCAPDLAADGVAGRTFPVGDVEALAAALRDTLLRPPSLQQIAERSGQFSVGAAADGVVEAAAWVTRGRRRRARPEAPA